MNYNFFPFLHFFNASVFLYLISIILYKDYRSWLNRASSAFLVCFSIWSVGAMFVNGLAETEVVAMWANNFSSFGWVNFAPFFLLFSLVFIKKKEILKKRSFYFLLFFPAAIFIYMQITNRLLVNYVRQPYGWIYHWSENIWSYLFMAYYFSLLVSSFYILIRHKKNTKFQNEKKQVDIIVAAGFFAFVFGSISNVIFPKLSIYFLPPLADVGALAWAIGMVYAMVRYKFLGITPALAAENIISTMLDALVLVDLKGKIITVNKATLDILGYAQEELIGQPIDIIFTKKDFRDILLQSVQIGENIKNQEFNFRAKDRRGIPVVFSSTVLKNDVGDAIGIACLARDIVDLKKIEQALQEKISELKDSQKSISEAYNDLAVLEREVEGEHDRVAAIISNFNDPIIFVDGEGRVRLFNPAAHEILGIKSEAMDVKIDSKNNYSLENFSSIINKKFTVKRAGESRTIGRDEEELAIKHEGQDMTYKVVTKKVMQKKEFLGTMKIFHNLTREKEIDKLKSEFITIAAHQLRTPLSAIKWVIKLVLDEDVGKINNEQKELLIKGYKSNERIIALVNDMLNVSRIEEGKFGYIFSKDDFLSLLNEAIGAVNEQITQKQIKFSFKKPEKIPQITFDRNKLILVLQNLLENAIKYTPEHGTVSVKVILEEKCLKTSIKDNGVGIPEEDQDKIFTKFFRAENVMRMQTEGSGLGLFMVKNIIHKHGGEISYSSREGKGSEFIFTLPLK